MSKLAKILVSFLLIVIGFLCLGLWPYIPGPGVLISIGLFISAMVGVSAVWGKSKKKEEGDIFKNSK